MATSAAPTQPARMPANHWKRATSRPATTLPARHTGKSVLESLDQQPPAQTATPSVTTEDSTAANTSTLRPAADPLPASTQTPQDHAVSTSNMFPVPMSCAWIIQKFQVREINYFICGESRAGKLLAMLCAVMHHESKVQLQYFFLGVG